MNFIIIEGPVYKVVIKNLFNNRLLLSNG